MIEIPEFELYCQQEAIELPSDLVSRLENAGKLALGAILGLPKAEDHVLSELDFVEVTLIDDETIARVHQDFMDIPGATDVITFHHGEILISLETAMEQAKNHDEPMEREIFRYLVHGLLHLHGHTDAEQAKREAMHAIQEDIVTQFWD